ncbi:uncharacterized protein LOC117316414 [Pecten maximus]|uniref:uncharacterized protein LOC117316414 n=1 Tax=Pecten maximus TaxID=6579 RepID=UPI001458A5E6|nr:uncharacterized protein LOC117316414 [Pecten maximus]
MAAKTGEKIPTASVSPQQVSSSKTTSVKVAVKTVQENKWTENTASITPDDSGTGNTGTGNTILTVVILILKFCVLGMLIAAVGLQVQSLFNSYWGYDDYFDFGYEGRIYHSLWGFYELGDPNLFSVHKEGNWQDWKKPIIKFQCIALALGLAATLLQLILVTLTFVHPHKAVKVALLAAVILLALGGGGLVVRTVTEFKKSRPFLGFGANAISSTTILKTITQDGYTQAFASGATYIATAFLSVILIVLVVVKHAKEPTAVTPLKPPQEA